MESLLFPIVKDGKLDEFKNTWGKWFVIDSQDTKTPGLMKYEFITRNGEMVALCPKSYFAHEFENNLTKRSSKGIPARIELDGDLHRNTLYNTISEPNRFTFENLKLSKNKIMQRSSLDKKGLTDLYFKLCVGNDKISCSPLKLDGQYI